MVFPTNPVSYNVLAMSRCRFFSWNSITEGWGLICQWLYRIGLVCSLPIILERESGWYRGKKKRLVLRISLDNLAYYCRGCPLAAFLSSPFPFFLILSSLLLLCYVCYKFIFGYINIVLIIYCRVSFISLLLLFSLPLTVMIFSLRVSLLRNLRSCGCEKVAVKALERQQLEEQEQEEEKQTEI